MVWKVNKHGDQEQDTIMCFKCQWWQPILEGQPQNGGGVRGVTVDPVSASETGYCRKKSVPVFNCNASTIIPTTPATYAQMWTADPFMSPTESLQEVVQLASTQFWCRHWTRSTVPFTWPPTGGS